MSTAAQKASANALFSFVSLEAAATRATARDVAAKIQQEIALTRNYDASRTSLLTQWADIQATLSTSKAARELADVELLLRSKRKHTALMEMYNPLYGMSEQDRIRATARTVGLEVPVDQVHD
ncbi:mitochondrial proton-transporting ATP synthase complex assembly protein [Malassezia pachydermatis]|uniref:Uncharacterized protein n=1 Tax=Malassezia pachydermatis TaxID=77020 RepID=A0A0M9VN63_9BASI|nr:hypothetical protein Malapachy_1515 [Malassezia pachydermatis]KOS13019.1 hypothetical protein Malapachy_1515 [Malassezia pachydermatis]